MGIYSKSIKNNITFILTFMLLLSAQLIYLKIGLGLDEAYYLFKANSMLSGSLAQNDSWMIGGYPVFYSILSLILLIFGKSVMIPRLILFIINGLNAIILFKIGSDFWDIKIGKVSSILYLIGVLMPAFQSHWVLTEPFMLFFGLIGIYLFLKCDRWIYLILSGVLFSLSSLCKTIGLLYIVSIGIYFIFNLRDVKNQNRKYIISSIKKMSLEIFGYIIPVFIGYLYFYHIDSVSTYFVFAMSRFLSVYGHQLIIWQLIKIFMSYSIIWIFSLVTMCIFGYDYIYNRYNQKNLLILICFFMFLYPLSSRQYGHYFIPILPFACILSSVFIINIIQKFKLELIREAFIKRDYYKIFALLCITGMVVSSFAYNLYMGNTTLKNGNSLYNEQLKTSNYIKAHTSETDNILVLGYEPSIYYLSGREPPVNILIFDKYRYNEKVENEIINKLKNDSIYIITPPNGKMDGVGKNIETFVNNNYQLEESIGGFDIYLLNNNSEYKS